MQANVFRLFLISWLLPVQFNQLHMFFLSWFLRCCSLLCYFACYFCMLFQILILLFLFAWINYVKIIDRIRRVDTKTDIEQNDVYNLLVLTRISYFRNTLERTIAICFWKNAKKLYLPPRQRSDGFKCPYQAS